MGQTVVEIVGDAATLFGPTGLLQLLVGRPVREGQLEEVPECHGALQRVVRQGAAGAEDLEDAVETTTRGDRDEEGVTSRSVRGDLLTIGRPDRVCRGSELAHHKGQRRALVQAPRVRSADRSEAGLNRDRVLLDAHVARGRPGNRGMTPSAQPTRRPGQQWQGVRGARKAAGPRR